MANYSEKTRVQIPAIMHLTRLGYTYLSKKDVTFDKDTNFIIEIFNKSIKRINPSITENDLQLLLIHIKDISNFDDLGKAFYKRLTETSTYKLIDFKNPDNNVFNVMYEVPFRNGEEEFRPDVTLFINGMPLGFLEVKVPDNDSLIKAESDRMRDRFSQKLFNRFLNIIQLMTFSNNMEYEEDSISKPVQGTFYCARARKNAYFSTFREEDSALLTFYSNKSISKEAENTILKDTNALAIKGSSEYQYNIDGLRPTNRICTSLFSKERFLFLLEYGICYNDEYNEETQKTVTVKHIMRYPQLFASLNIKKYLDSGKTNGIIWHTQGSGKTELAYYQVKLLTDYYAKKNIIPRFYFIVDRLQLFKQATMEFKGRGLKVINVSSKKEFSDSLKDIKSSGTPEITVVNIQKFSDENSASDAPKYDTNVQRIYFLDEAHRSYNMHGRFLANLISSDTKAVKIALTGTPIVNEDFEDENYKPTLKEKVRGIKINTTQIFGNYIHTYYYNLSIKDGYTLRLIREDILTTYKEKINAITHELKIKAADLSKKDIKSHPKYCGAFVDYIIDDFETFKIQNKHVDATLDVAAMIVCDSNQQAKEVYRQLVEEKGKTALLILYDYEDKEWREKEIYDYKYTNKYDYVVVDDMLLTGFDCKRVKKMYLGKKLRAHTLLQALTRVNRPFGKMQYGYIVDFENISEEFEKINKIYARELKKLNGDITIDLDKILLSDEEIKHIVSSTEEALFIYDTSNMEKFQSQIDAINSLDEINKLKRIIDDACNVYNVAKINDNVSSFTISIDTLNEISKMVNRRSKALRFKIASNDEQGALNMLNEYMDLMEFSFIKLGEKELVMADKQREILKKVKREFNKNFDNKDPRFIGAYERLKELLKASNIEEISQELIDELNKLYDNIYTLNQYDEQLTMKYSGDKKFTRIHKRLLKILPIKETQLYKVLIETKKMMDDLVENNEYVLESTDYVEKEVASKTIDIFENNNVNVEVDKLINISQLIVSEYVNQFRGVSTI